MEHDRKSNEELVRSLDDQERAATLSRDIPALQALWSEEFLLNSPSNQLVVGRDAILDAFVHTKIINFSAFERQVELIRADGEFVFIMGGEIVTPVSDAPSVGLASSCGCDRHSACSLVVRRPRASDRSGRAERIV